MTLRHEFHHLTPTLTYACESEADTAKLAGTLARYLVGGDVLKLEGDLGAGKTTFTHYLLTALGHAGETPSPTYTLVQEYADTRLPVAHIDAYRLNDPEELEALGLKDYLRHGLIICEWPSKTGNFLNGKQEWIDYHLQSVLNPGTLTVTFNTPFSEGVIASAARQSQEARIITLTGSISWQRRFALFNPAVPRPSTPQGREAFLATTPWAGSTIESIGADMSLRSYWRVRKPDGSTCLLMDSPPQEGVRAYAEAADYYRSVGLRAPEIYAVDEPQGYLLLEEFVGPLLAEKVQQADPQVNAWYETAMDVIIRLCQSTPPPGARHMTPADFFSECKSMMDYGLPLTLGRAATIAERMDYESRFAPLMKRFFSLPKGFLMWDYMSMNLICMHEPSLHNFGLIDIQDARLAPFAQDAGLLLRDMRRSRDDALEKRMVSRLATGLGLTEEDVQWAISVDAMLQYTRVAGNLCRMVVRDQKTTGAKRYLPRAWEIIRQTQENITLCPEAKPLLDFLLPLQAPMLQKIQEL